jgi:hypothetical protein
MQMCNINYFEVVLGDKNCLITIGTYPYSRFFGGVVNKPESNEMREPLLGLAIIGERAQSFWIFMTAFCKFFFSDAFSANLCNAG